MAKAKWPKLPSYFVPLFNSGRIYLCRDKDEFRSAMQAINLSADGIDSLNGLCRHIVNEKTGENVYLIGVFNGGVATLVHECAHAAFFVCHDFGVKVDTEAANETYCYMLDRMFSHFMPFIQEQQNAKAEE